MRAPFPEFPDYDPANVERLLRPKHLAPGLRRFIEDGVRPGDGLWSVLINAPVVKVIAALDEEAVANLKSLIASIICYAPDRCWGSVEAAEAWIKRGGIRGRAAA